MILRLLALLLLIGSCITARGPRGSGDNKHKGRGVYSVTQEGDEYVLHQVNTDNTLRISVKKAEEKVKGEFTREQALNGLVVAHKNRKGDIHSIKLLQRVGDAPTAKEMEGLVYALTIRKRDGSIVFHVLSKSDGTVAFKADQVEFPSLKGADNEEIVPAILRRSGAVSLIPASLLEVKDAKDHKETIEVHTFFLTSSVLKILNREKEDAKAEKIADKLPLGKGGDKIRRIMEKEPKKGQQDRRHAGKNSGGKNKGSKGAPKVSDSIDTKVTDSSPRPKEGGKKAAGIQAKENAGAKDTSTPKPQGVGKGEGKGRGVGKAAKP